MKFYRNKNWSGKREYHDCTQVLACEAPDDVTVDANYVECEQDEIAHLEHIYTQGQVRYFGYL